MENIRCFAFAPVLDTNRKLHGTQTLADTTFAVFSHETIYPDNDNVFAQKHYVAIVEAVYKIVNVYIVETCRFMHNYVHTFGLPERITGWYLPANLNEQGHHRIMPLSTSVRYDGRVGSVWLFEHGADETRAYEINTPFSAPTKNEVYQQIIWWLKSNRKRADVRFHGLVDGDFVVQGKRLYEDGQMKKV